MTVTYVAEMSCEQGQKSPGIVLSKRPHSPLRGMHLLPGLIETLPGKLRDARDVAHPGQAVTVVHTFKKAYVPFCDLAPGLAGAVAAEIERVWAAR